MDRRGPRNKLIRARIGDPDVSEQVVITTAKPERRIKFTVSMGLRGPAL